MIKRMLYVSLFIFMCLTIVGCSSFINNEQTQGGGGVFQDIIVIQHRVNFYIDGKLDSYVINYENQLIKEPIQEPYKENHKFLGWYTSSNQPYDFSKPLKSSIDLYAKFEMDYAKIINLLSTEYISTNVEIHVKHWNTRFLGLGEKDVIHGVGSGVIFADAHDNYYVLTNNHVVYEYGRSKHEYKIQDYKGNTYSAKLFTNSAQADYDLATLYFAKGKEKLVVSKLATVNPRVDDEVISIGQPGGQNNAITFGSIQSYRTVVLKDTVKEASNVTFDVIMHSAPIAPGSSGGVLMNSSFEIIGINYAGPTDTNFSDAKYGLSIPVEKVREYLNKYIYE